MLMKRMIFLLFLCVVTISISAQIKNLKGKVVDTDGEPIIGASIVSSKDKGVGTITDIEGDFSIQIPDGVKTIAISCVSYKAKTINVSDKDFIAVTLEEDINILDELVVVGYGVQKKATMTGAVSSIGSEQLNKRTVASMSTALQGTMPGLTVQNVSGEPGADGSSLRVRGIGSINSSKDPLVLVDGIEMDMNQVDMSTVENVSVLKDAASASIYGSRASNGVILITTKRGAEGKVKVGYSGSMTIQTPTNMPKVVGAADYLQAEMDSWKNSNTNQTLIPDREVEIEMYRKYHADNWNRYDTNWKKATVANTAILHNHSVNLTGGNEALKYFGALSYLSQDGLIKNNDYNRLNIRVNTDAKLLSWMTLSNEVAYRDSNQKTPAISSPKSIINKSLYMLPTLSGVKDIDGNWGFGKNGDNPVAQAEDGGTQNIKKPELLLNATLTLTPLKGLDLQAQYSFRETEERSTTRLIPYRTSFKGIDKGTYPGQDAVNELYTQARRNYYRTQATYAKELDKHNGKILFGFQADDSKFESLGAGMQGFDLDKYYLNNGDKSTATATGAANSWSMASFYGRFNYDFANKYLFEFSGRYDGSSRFMRNNRWGFFPSVSGGWVISDELFMEKTKSVLDHLKFRASYGVLGNQDIGNYPYASQISTGYSYWIDKQLTTGVAQTALSNPDITWEKSSQFNIGIDGVLLNQKLSVTFDYYVKKMYDMLMKFPVPYYVGMSPAFTNAGDMENKGWELSLRWNDKIGEVHYGVTTSFSNNKNKITDLKGYIDPSRSMVEGYPNGAIWGYKTDGYYQSLEEIAGSPLLSKAAQPGFVKYVKTYHGDDAVLTQIEDRDKIYLGDPFPHYEYSVNLTANWKGFDFTAFFQGVGKRDVMMSGIGLKPFANGSNLFTHQLDSWREDNRDAAYPILVPEANSADNYATSDKWVRSGAYLRMKNLMLGYTLPKTLLNKIQIDNVRVYFSGQNLFTVSSFYKGYDPEASYGGTGGGEFYPIMQTFTFGLDFKF